MPENSIDNLDEKVNNDSYSKKSRLGADERRQELLRFGQEFFAHNRFDSLTMKDLAKRAGVSKGLVYHYFGDRRGYYLATMSFTMDEIIQVFTISNEDQSRTLRELFTDLTNYFKSTRHFYLMSTQSGDEDIRKEISRVKEVILSRALELNGSNINTSLGDVILRGWMAFCQSVIADWLTTQTISQTELVDVILSQLTFSLTTIESISEYEKQQCVQEGVM